MTRLAVIFIIACTLLGASFYVWTADQKSAEEELEAKKKDLEAKMNAKGTVVYAIRDVPEGDVFTADALEQRSIEQSKIPQDAIDRSFRAVGKKVKFGVSAGQIVSYHDLDPDPLRRQRLQHKPNH